MIESTQDILISKFKQFNASFEDFVKFFFKHYLTFDIPEFHHDIYVLLSSSPRVVLATPRGHGKSTICSIFYPIWLSVFQKKKDIVIISASETLAVDWLRQIKRELENNQLLIEFFKQFKGYEIKKSDKWTENHVILDNERRVNIRARGAQGQIRGFRPDCIICDDLETNETVESEEQRKKLKDWIFKDCLNTLLPEGQFIVIGTIIHPLSVLSDLLNVDNGWVKRKYQAYREGKQEVGYELWPALWTHQKLQDRKREIGTWAFASEYMNNPMSDETAPVKEHQIRFWEELPKTYSCVIAVDPAYSEDEHADYKVASLVAIDPLMNRYLIRYVRTHAPIGEYEDAILNMYLGYKDYITQLGIPNSGVEKGFFDSFMKKCQQRNIFPPVVELKNTFTNSDTGVSKRNKKARIIAALQPLFENGKYYIHRDHVEAREELLTIGSSRWDDIVDSMAYAEQILTPVFYEVGNTTYHHTQENIDRGTTGYGEEY